MSDPTVALLQALMDASATRQTVLANNVANANTPGYTRRDVDFRSELARALESDRPAAALAHVHPRVSEDRTARARGDGNNVSLQRELGQMAQNRLLYDVSAQALSARYARLRSAIRGQ
jgi:flagellar basal-body rod protein FlgB